MPDYELAQFNTARMIEPMDTPRMADFVANLERINALAEGSDGFVWRLQTEEGDSTALRPIDEFTLINVSVWRDVASLSDYVFRTAHVDIMRRRREWFERTSAANIVLWWVAAGHRPDTDEALDKLDQLRRDGPTAAAFTFRKPHPPPR